MKKGNYLLVVVLAALAFGSVSCTYYTNPEEPGFVLPQPPEQGYVGATKCAQCHDGMYNNFQTTGHAHALSKVENGVAPTFPHTTVDFVPLIFQMDGMMFHTLLVGLHGDICSPIIVDIYTPAMMHNLILLIIWPFHTDRKRPQVQSNLIAENAIPRVG